MSDERLAEPRHDAAREDRLKGLLLDFALGSPSGKHFDVEEMRLLRDDVTAMVREIDDRRAELQRVYAVNSQNANLLREAEAEVERLRAPAQLGSALVDALRELAEDCEITIMVGPARTPTVSVFVDRLTDDDNRFAQSDATRALQSLLSALPVVEDAADPSTTPVVASSQREAKT